MIVTILLLLLIIIIMIMNIVIVISEPAAGSPRQGLRGSPKLCLWSSLFELLSGVHKGGFSEGGFSNLCVIIGLLPHPPLLNPLL